MSQKVYENLGELQENLVKGSNIFLVTGKKLFESCREKYAELLDEQRVTRFSNFSPNPKLKDIEKGLALYRAGDYNIIMGIGGGSAIDMAKLIKGLAGEDNLVKAIEENRVSKPSLANLIAVPTTSGSGSESTPFAVAYVDGKKYSLQNRILLPNEIVLDSELTAGLPKKVAAASGMDAFCQAVESYWSVNSTEKSREYSREAIRLVLDNFVDSVNHTKQMNRAAMMKAANLSGKAIAIAKTTACHSISYPLTSGFGIPHGHAVALTLGPVFEYNSGVVAESCMDSRGSEYVKNIMGDLRVMLQVSSAEEARGKIETLMRDVGLETRLSQIGVTDYESVIQQGFNPQRMKNNPRKIDKGNLRDIMRLVA